MSEKESAINFLLNNLMDVVEELPGDPRIGVRYTISACLRFATRAAIMLGLSPDEIEKELQEEWMWNEARIRSEDSDTGILN
jgi:hypothetical protein